MDHPSSNKIPQLVIDLILLFQDTDELCAQLSLSGKRILDDLQEDLPGYFGQLIRELDILDNFTRLGKTVRNFRDAKEVLAALNDVIIEKAQHFSEEQVSAQFRDLEELCYEVGRRFAAYDDERITKYPDDFLPGQIYSDN